MSNDYFSFKQFTVQQQHCAMKVGIDGVLLGSWAACENAERVLDIGTGTGLIALMIAQRSNSTVDAIEIDENAVLQAKENVMNSSWPDRINIHKVSLQDYTLKLSVNYDLIVSNPPYFVNSLKTPDKNRTNARHTDSLTHQELIENAKQLLKPTGRICIILPVVESMHCIEFALKKGLFCSKHCVVYPKPKTKSKRILLEFSLKPVQTELSEITIETDVRHQYTSSFIGLVKDFYLKL